MNNNRIVVVVVWLAMVALSLWAWTIIPAGAHVPMHWDLHGNPNGWGSRDQVLWGGPGMTLFVLATIMLAARFDPRKEHVEQSRKAIDAIMVILVLFMLVIHWAVLWAATGHPVDISQVVLVAMGLLFAGLGNVLGKTRSNFFAGFRTPWTLSSERAWALSHRLGGRMFVALGLGTSLFGLLGLYGLATGYFVVGLFFSLGFTFYYGYKIWKEDPDKIEPGK
ncbi:MAG: SdpI family protein [Vulcanimicrobiota bacterium]